MAMTLSNLAEDVTIPASGVTIDLGTLREGDANDTNCVRGNDFSILRSTYWRGTGDVGFDARADFDRSGFINAADFSLLRTHYWECGD